MASPRLWLLPAALLLALTPAASAEAAPTWTASAAAGTVASQTAVAYDGSGNATAAWIQTDSSGSSVWTARRDAGAAAFSTATRLTAAVSSGTVIADAPQLAVDSAGNAIVAWVGERPSGSTDTVTIATRNGAAGTWSGPVAASDTSLQSLAPSVGFSATGTAVLAYDQTPSSGYAVGQVATVSTATGAVSALQTISNGSAAVTDLHLAFNAKGAGELIWTQTTVSFSPPYTGTSVLQGSYRAAGVATFPAATQIYNSSPNANAVDESQVTIDDNGNAGVVWSTVDTDTDAQLAVAASTKAPTASGWSGIYLSRTGASQPRVAVSGLGGFVAAYVQGATDGSANGTGTVRVARRAPGATSWAAAADLSATGVVATAPTLAAGSQGTTIASWISRPGSGDQVQGAVLPAGASTFLAPQNLDAAGGTIDAPGAAVDGSGNALVVWGRSGSTSRAARLDGSTVVATATPTPTPVATATPVPTAAPTPVPTAVPAPTPTPAPTDPTATPVPGATPAPTATPTPFNPAATPVPSSAPAATSTPTPTPDPTNTPSVPGTSTSGSGSGSGAGTTTKVTATTPAASSVKTPVLPAPSATVGTRAATAAGSTIIGVAGATAAGAVSAATATSGPAPSLRAFKAITPRRFHAAASGGSIGSDGVHLAFTTNVAGTLRMIVTTMPKGGKAKNLKPVITAPLTAGTTQLVFTGRLGSAALPAGRYRLKAVFVDAAGRASNKRVLNIAISR